MPNEQHSAAFSPSNYENYRTASETERKRIRAAVVVECREKVGAFVRRILPREHHEEAIQCGIIGLLVALDKYDDAIAGPDLGKKSFWGYAFPFVQNEISNWVDRGIHWRPRARNARNSTAEAKAQRRQLSMDAVQEVLGTDMTLHDLFSDDKPNAEEIVGEFEASVLLNEFTETLTNEDRKLLFTKETGRPRSSRYLSLVGRAKAAVLGDANGVGSETRSER